MHYNDINDKKAKERVGQIDNHESSESGRGGRIINDERDHHGNMGNPNKKKRCYYMIGGLVLLIAVIVIIVVATMKKGGDDPTPPGPTPPSPVTPGYNPYSVDDSSVVTERSKVTGILKATQGAKVVFPEHPSELKIIEHTKNLISDPSASNYASFRRNGLKSRVGVPL